MKIGHSDLGLEFESVLSIASLVRLCCVLEALTGEKRKNAHY